MEEYLRIYRDFSLFQLKQILDEPDKYEPEAIAAVQQILEEKKITAAELQDAQQEVELYQQEKNQLIDRKIYLAMHDQWKGYRQMTARLRMLDVNKVFWIWFVFACILILFHVAHAVKEIMYWQSFGRGSRYEWDPNPWNNGFTTITILGILPLAAIILGFRKKPGWSLLMIGFIYLIPRFVFHYLYYIDGPGLPFLSIVSLNSTWMYFMMLPLLMGVSIYKFSTRSIREYLKISSTDVWITYSIGVAAAIAPYYKYL